MKDFKTYTSLSFTFKFGTNAYLIFIHLLVFSFFKRPACYIVKNKILLQLPFKILVFFFSELLKKKKIIYNNKKILNSIGNIN